MSDHAKLAIFLLVVVFIGIPFLGTLDPPPVDVPAESKAAGKPGAHAKPGAPAAVAKPAAPAAPAAPMAAPLLNAGNLVNTVWSMDGATVTLLGGGQLTAKHPSLPMSISGTWSVNGASLTVVAMGQTKTATISGNDILIGGKPAQRMK